MRYFAAVVVIAASCVVAECQSNTISAEKPKIALRAMNPTPGIKHSEPTALASGSGKLPNASSQSPVVTIQGVCRQKQEKGKCETVITRSDLDQFVTAFAPNSPDTARGGLAIEYARTLAFSALAEKEGFDRNPALVKELEFQLDLLRKRILTSAYLQTVQSHTTEVEEAEIQKYYDAHRQLFEEANVRRVAIPLIVPTENGRPLDRSAVKVELEDLRKRAIAGENLDQLLQTAFKHLNIQAPPPPANISVLRRGGTQGDEAKTFDLKPGEISNVLDLAASYAVIKLESINVPPMESVRQEITAVLRRERMQNVVSNLTKTIDVKFNLEYLGLSTEPNIFALSPSSSAVPSRIRQRSNLAVNGKK